jgi:hypothetical protein
MVCPNCNSSNLKRVSLIHAAGVYESRGRFRGLLFGGTDGALFGRYRGTSQSRLSALSNPPARAPYRWTDHFMANRIFHPDVFRWTRKTFLGNGCPLRRVPFSSTRLSSRVVSSITSSFAPQNTGDGKRNSCASAAEQFLSPKTPSPSSLPHMCQRRGAPIEALTVEAVHEWALPRGCGSSGNGIESAVV